MPVSQLTRYSSCSAAVQESFIKPKLHSIHELRKTRADSLSLPAVDEAAAEALGRSRNMSLVSSMTYPPLAEQINKNERCAPLLSQFTAYSVALVSC